MREDRLALEIAANAVASIRETAKAGDIVKAAQLTAARQALSSLGGTPVDRSKIHIPDDPGISRHVATGPAISVSSVLP